MAGRISRKDTDNFEKIKKEMTAKKQKAKMQKITLPIELSVEKESQEYIAPKVQQENKETIIAVKKIEVIVFKVDVEEFALNISNIKEIIRVPTIIKIPNAPLYVTGLCSLRGDLLPVIDSRKLFDIPHKESDDSSRIIVTDIHGNKVGLLCDKVTEVITVEESAVKEPPGSIKGINGGILNSILILDNGKRVVMLLDAEKITKACGLVDMEKEQLTSELNLKGLEMKEDVKEQIIIFNVGIGEYGLSINYVKEIIRLPDIMRVSNTPSYIEGVFSIRNQLLEVVNLGNLLGVDCKQLDESSRVAIMDNGDFSFGVIVDKVSHVMVVDKKLFKESSDIARSSYIKGIYNLNEGKRLIVMLEPLNLISYGQLKCMD